MKNKKKTSNSFRTVVRQLHLWLGMATGLVVFIVAITGCCWVFRDEIKALTSSLPEIELQDKVVLTPTEARAKALKIFPGREVHGTLFAEANEPLEVIFYEAEPKFYQSVFLHPYTGEVLAIEDHLSGFFAFVLDGHMHLWLPDSIGTEVVRWSTVIFVLMLISGIILWWPKNKRARKQRFKFDWKKTTKWKRKNYDLHSILGFYASFVGLIIAYTGLVMAFDAFAFVTHKAWGGEKQLQFQVPANVSVTPVAHNDLQPIDQLLPKLRAAYPNALDFEFHYPETDSSAIYVEISNQDGVYYNSDFRFYDQYSLEEIPSETIWQAYDQAGVADKVLRMNYDTHVGAIGGLPGKILAFLISLSCASLPVTGFMIWYGRKFKKKKSLRPEKTVHQNMKKVA